MKDWYQYEHAVCKFHAAHYGQTVYHWNHIPEEIMIHSGFINNANDLRLLREANIGRRQMREFGLDGIAIDSYGVCHGLQAKMWTSTLCASDLGSFLSVIHGRLHRKHPDSQGFLYHTTRIQRDLLNDLRLMPNIHIKQYHWQTQSSSESSSSSSSVDCYIGHIQRNEAEFDLHPPQKQALDALMLAYQTGWSGPQKLKLPCGMGKTLVTSHFLQQAAPDCIIIVSPLCIHAMQAFHRVSRFMPDHEHILVDSDHGAVSAHDLNERIKNKDKVLISTTYDSYELIKHLNAFVVFDEAHNLTEEQLEEIEDLPMSLLLTATPPTLLDDVPTVFEYSMREAINNEYICDYQIHLPVMEDILIPVEVKKSDLTHMILFFISGMLEAGSTKAIAYCHNQAECARFSSEFKKISIDYHYLESTVKTITSETSAKDRAARIKKFQDSVNKLSVLASVRILNEGVDIPECDSILLTSTSGSEITAVQRVCRANRKTQFNPNKIANVFIYCNDVDSGAGVLTTLKYDDPEFLSKIRLISANYDTKHEAAAVAKKEEQLPAVIEKTKEKIQIRSQVYEDNIKEKIQKIEEYFVREGRRPHQKAEGEKTLAYTLNNMDQRYKKNEQMMKNPEIKDLWAQVRMKFPQHFWDTVWDFHLNEAQARIDAKGKKPSPTATDKVEKRLGSWIGTQKLEYKNNKMLEDYRTKWAVFIAKNAEILMTLEELWQHQLQKSQTFMQEYKKRPSRTKEGEEALGQWLNKQITEYNKGRMHKDRRAQFEEHRNEFKDLLN